jgi:hypothetical protein
MSYDPGALMEMHVEALFTHDAEGRLRRVNEPGGAEAPRFFLGRTAEGAVWRFRHDVDAALRRELEAAGEGAGAARYGEILARAAPVMRAEAGPAFAFPPELPAADDAADDVVRVTEANAYVLQPPLDAWLADVRWGAPLFALVADGRAAAVCASVRQTGAAHEAGVETAPADRGRGYAARVVAAWARAVRELGRVPLYSTSWENAASRAVARTLGLVHFGDDLHFT